MNFFLTNFNNSWVTGKGIQDLCLSQYKKWNIKEQNGGTKPQWKKLLEIAHSLPDQRWVYVWWFSCLYLCICVNGCLPYDACCSDIECCTCHPISILPTP